MLAVADDLTESFTTMVGLITTRSSVGDNVMAAEWTYLISYEPMLLAVVVGPRHATHGAIVESKEFGVSLAAQDQFPLTSFAGGTSRRETAKLSSTALKTREGQAIKAPIVEEAYAQFECKLVNAIPLGDHTLFVGEVVAGRRDMSKAPLLLGPGYRKLGERLPRGEHLIVALTPMPDGSRVADAFYYADARADKMVEFEARDANGAALARASAATDRWGWAQWVVPPEARGATIVHGRAGAVVGEAGVAQNTTQLG